MRMSVMQPVRFVANGELAVGVSQVQGPDIRCKMVYVKANNDNAGYVNIGFVTGVPVTNEGTDTTTGIELAAGQDSPLMIVGNLSELFFIATQASQGITYALVDTN
jgi:hypothetical protein